MKNGIKNWPHEDRPREKLIIRGAHSLTNAELLAILIRTGTRGISALDCARLVIQKFKTFRNMCNTNLKSWNEFKGLGISKVVQIKAAIEIGRRFSEEEIKDKRMVINSSKTVVSLLMARMRDLINEIFKIILLDAQNRVIQVCEVEEGTINHAYPIIREIFKIAIQKSTVSIICVHNHPSGNPNPSDEDKKFTRDLRKSGFILGINVIDHIIIGDNIFFSFADEGLMGNLF